MKDGRVAWTCGFGAIAASVVVVAGASPFLPAHGLAAATAPVTIIDEWRSVQAPPPPPIKDVTVDPKTTAYLIFDILANTCNKQVRPRCVASVPRLTGMLARATTAGMLVVYSTLPGQTANDILAEVRPFSGQPVVAALTDKFLGTNLDGILKGADIKTVIIAGTAANGAVITTAAEAALRGYKVAVPVDLMSGSTTYAEQYTAWHLTNSPVIPANITLTRSDLIHF